MRQDKPLDRFRNCALSFGPQAYNNIPLSDSQCARAHAALTMVLLATALWFLGAGVVSAQDMHNPSEAAAPGDDLQVQAKIKLAMSAGPPDVASGARIADMGKSGKLIVLREGHNGFTCMPGHGDTSPAMCADEASMQWFADFAAHKPKPTNTVPGITYMLAGATQRSDSDPYDTTSPLIQIGPHWMILWPFDPDTTGLPTKHKPTGAYIMFPRSPYAHLHVMGRP